MRGFADSPYSPPDGSPRKIISRDKKKRVTLEGIDGAKYSLQGKRIGRPKIDRSHTKCCSCQATHTPQWRYVSKDDDALRCLAAGDSELELIGSASVAAPVGSVGLSGHPGGGCDGDGTPSPPGTPMPSPLSLPSGAGDGLSTSQRDSKEQKLCLCNACWLRVHKARQKHSKGILCKRQVRKRPTLAELGNHSGHIGLGGVSPNVGSIDFTDIFQLPPAAVRPYESFMGSPYCSPPLVPSAAPGGFPLNSVFYPSTTSGQNPCGSGPEQHMSLVSSRQQQQSPLPPAAHNSFQSHQLQDQLSNFVMNSLERKSPRVAAHYATEPMGLMSLFSTVESIHNPFSLVQQQQQQQMPFHPTLTHHRPTEFHDSSATQPPQEFHSPYAAAGMRSINPFSPPSPAPLSALSFVQASQSAGATSTAQAAGQSSNSPPPPQLALDHDELTSGDPSCSSAAPWQMVHYGQ